MNLHPFFFCHMKYLLVKYWLLHDQYKADAFCNTIQRYIGSHHVRETSA